MTIEEAKLFFPFEEEDDLEDLYEERLFEYKQFFLSKALLKKVFSAKIKKMLKMHQAYELLVGESLSHKKIDFAIQFTNSDLVAVFSEFQAQKNKLKLFIQQANSAVEIEQVLELYFQLQEAYIQQWPLLEVSDDESIQVSVEPDDMELLKALKEVSKSGAINILDIVNFNSQTVENNSMNMIVMEAKRLSLLRKIDRNE